MTRVVGESVMKSYQADDRESNLDRWRQVGAASTGSMESDLSKLLTGEGDQLSTTTRIQLLLALKQL